MTTLEILAVVFIIVVIAIGMVLWAMYMTKKPKEKSEPTNIYPSFSKSIDYRIIINGTEGKQICEFDIHVHPDKDITRAIDVIIRNGQSIGSILTTPLNEEGKELPFQQPITEQKIENIFRLNSELNIEVGCAIMRMDGFKSALRELNK